MTVNKIIYTRICLKFLYIHIYIFKKFRVSCPTVCGRHLNSMLELDLVQGRLLTQQGRLMGTMNSIDTIHKRLLEAGTLFLCNDGVKLKTACNEASVSLRTPRLLMDIGHTNSLK